MGSSYRYTYVRFGVSGFPDNIFGFVLSSESRRRSSSRDVSEDLARGTVAVPHRESARQEKQAIEIRVVRVFFERQRVCVLCCLLGTVLRSHVLFGIPPLEKRGPAPLLPTPLHAPCLNKCAITGSSGELRMSGWAMGERHKVRPSTNSRSLSTDYCREFLVNFPNHQDSAQKELENVAADDDHHVPAGSVPSVKSLHS